MTTYLYFKARHDSGWPTKKNHHIKISKGNFYKINRDRLADKDYESNKSICEYLSPAELLVATEGDMDQVLELL